MAQFLFHTTVIFFKNNIHYTCIASLDVETMCFLYCTLLYDHIVLNVNAPRGPVIGEIK